MSDQWIFIQAHDVWMFRDSKPFTAQQTFNAKSQFPPNPQTIQGVIRSHYLESKGVNWAEYAHGTADSSLYSAVGSAGTKNKQYAPSMGNLHIQGPYIARRGDKNQLEMLIPAPLDLMYHAIDKKYALLSLAPKANFVTGGIFNGWRPLQAPKDYKHQEGVWLSQSQFADYLNGKIPTGDLIPQCELFTTEDRIGLGLDYGRRANRDEHLYRAKFIRPHDEVGILVHVNSVMFNSPTGYVRVGGESRSGRYSVVSFTPPKHATTTGNLKVVLLTPAYFSEGWQPQNGDWSGWVGQGKLVSAVIGKPLAISGWDVANNRPKPLRHYVPAGSVYYFENATWQNNPFTESPQGEAQFSQMGFGCVGVGKYQ